MVSLISQRHLEIDSSPAILLYQNNLNFTDDQNHSSFLLIPKELTFDDATEACESFSETLLTSSQAKQYMNDLAPLIKYETYRGDIQSHESLWLSDGLITSDAQILSKDLRKKLVKKKALCTQSNSQTLSTNSTASSRNLVRVASKTTNSNFLGYRNKKSFRFLGISYSNDPSRWQYAKVNEDRNKEVNATSFGSECYQTGSGDMSEKCLYLNIFTPYLPQENAFSASRASKMLRPVVFWIHGGAFTSGSGSDPTVDGGNMVSRGDVVQVTINYRLSTLGFLAVPGTDIKGNYGIADQMIALKWVRQNIECK